MVGLRCPVEREGTLDIATLHLVSASQTVTAMNQFIVVFREPIADSAVVNNALIADTFQLSDSALLVRSSLDSPGHVRRLFKMSSEEPDPNLGVVLKLEGSYAGYDDDPLWDWLSQAHVSYSA